jgi:hypothetical protein
MYPENFWHEKTNMFAPHSASNWGKTTETFEILKVAFGDQNSERT